MRAEEKLLESENEYSFASELNEHLAWVADAKGGAIWLSDKLLDIVGLEFDEALGAG